MNPDKTAQVELWYRRIARVSVGAVLFLILVGGIVRSTGSGMGCPDWPKCFGLLVPPTTVEEIPPAFFESHPQFQEKSFNAVQTWVEYVNRLVGAAIGLLMLITSALSLGFWKRDRRIVLLSVLAMLLTGFEGWLGKLVVDRNLAGGMVTIHLLVAMLIMSMLILANYLVAVKRRPSAEFGAAGKASLAWLGLGLLLLTLVQVALGTQVREGVDEMAAQLGPMKRDGWLAPSLSYTFHKGVWMVLLAGLVVWLQNVWRALNADRGIRWLIMGLAVAVFLEVLLGMVLAYLDLPPAIQPLHMLFANLIFAAEFSIWLHVLGMKRLSSKTLNNDTLPLGATIDAE